MIQNMVGGGGKKSTIIAAGTAGSIPEDIFTQAEGVAPTVNEDGIGFGATFYPYGSEICDQIVFGFRKFTVPAYFTTFGGATPYFTFDWQKKQPLRILRIESVSVSFGASNTGGLYKLELLDLPNATSYDNDEGIMTATGQSSSALTDVTLKINAPKLQTAALSLVINGNTNKKVTMDIDLPKIQALNLLRANDAYCFTATLDHALVMPYLETLGSMNPPRDTTAVNEYRMPSLIQLQNDLNYAAFHERSRASGLAKLYIGPNLSSVSSLWATYLAAAVTAGDYELHIPAGETTTKTTLDGLSGGAPTYTQDYNYQEDIPS